MAQTITSKIQTGGSLLLSFRTTSGSHRCVSSSLFQILNIFLAIFYLGAVSNWKLCPVLQEIFHLVSLKLYSHYTTTLLFFLPAAPGNHRSSSLPMNLTISNSLYKWNHTIFAIGGWLISLSIIFTSSSIL